MNKGLTFGIGALTGLVVGATGAYFYVSKKVKEECEEEIREVRATYNKMAHELHEKNMKATETIAVSSIEEATEAYTSNEPEQIPVVEPEPQPEPQPEPLPIYLVDYNEFGTEDGYDVSSLYYFKNDGILTDEKYEELDNQEDYIGELDPDKFNDPNGVVYIRNDVRHSDFEVLLDERNFSEVK